MSSENSWIPWDEREDVQKYVVEEYSNGMDCYGDFIEICDYYYLGNIPNEYIEEFKKEVEENNEGYCFLTSIEQLKEQEINQALRFFVLHKDDKKGPAVYWWNLKKTYEKADKFKYELFCNNNQSTLESVPVVSDSSTDNISAKPKKQKATKKETQDAADLIIKYFDSGKRSFSLATISHYLEKELGQKFDLSSKTLLGKVYAVLYYQKKKIPPRGWTVGKIEEAGENVKHILSGK